MKEIKGIKMERRGRPKKQNEVVEFDSTSVQLFRGSELSFNESLFKPMKTNTEIDLILSTDGGTIMITVTCFSLFSRLWVNSWAPLNGVNHMCRICSYVCDHDSYVIRMLCM